MWGKGWRGHGPWALREEAAGRVGRRLGYVVAMAGSGEAGRPHGEGRGGGTSEEGGRLWAAG